MLTKCNIMKKSISVDSLIGKHDTCKSDVKKNVPKTLKKSVSLDNVRKYNVLQNVTNLVKSSTPCIVYDILKDMHDVNDIHDNTHIVHTIIDCLTEDVFIKTISHVVVKR